MNIIHTDTLDVPLPDRKEILRYAGVRGSVPEVEELLTECLQEITEKLTYKVCWTAFPVLFYEERLSLGFTETNSTALRRNLAGCTEVVVFAATIGIAIDRLIARYGAVSPAKALLFQAIGAERIEGLCDVFAREIAEQKAAECLRTRQRFSPGYGDFPLTVQKDIFAILDCSRKIGLSLNDSLLMSPSKSVTALIGITKK